MSQAIKIASFNLKHDSPFARKNTWFYRRELISELIRQSNAAIIGVQELLPSMREDIMARLSGRYSIRGFGRNKRMGDEQSAILLKNDDVKVSFDKVFWLSKHPEKLGSRAYYAVFPRICTVCEAYVEELGTKVRVFNTHFDHICGMARVLSVRIILQYMHELNQTEKLPTVLMGDLNAKPNSKPIRILAENLHDYDDLRLTSIWENFTQAEIFNTYHGFKGKRKGDPIDYIFFSEEFELEDAYIDQTSFDGRYPSDHYPLVATLRLKK